MNKSNTTQGNGRDMVFVPGGVFLSGEERESHFLPDFWISKTPVTNAAYAHFVTATSYDPPQHWDGDVPPVEIVTHPVVYVSWDDANAYAEWADARLPTEAEWEKAARGTDGRFYPWGEWREGRCNTKEAGVGDTTPVAKYSPDGDSLYGCSDMAGNVLEWTATVDGKYRRIRGGSYNHDRTLAGCAFHVRHKPSYRYRNIGFRIASDGD